MSFQYPFLIDEYELQQYDPPVNPCGNGEAVYFPKNVWASMAETLVLHDLLCSGLEVMMDKTFTPIRTGDMSDIRCELYKAVGISLFAGLVKEGDRFRCPEVCEKKEFVRGRIRKTKPVVDGTCPTGFRLERE